MHPTHRIGRRAAAVLLAMAGWPATAHDFRAGDIVIDHPYAVPSPAGSPHGAMYLRALRNTGPQADRLVGARTPAAASVEIHHMQLDTQNVMRMRAVDSLPLPPRAEVSLKHGGVWHLMLLNLKAPLQVGDRFPVTLLFARGGEKEVQVWVQQPRTAAPASHTH
jgi:periplasmic copper chaperone A